MSNNSPAYVASPAPIDNAPTPRPGYSSRAGTGGAGSVYSNASFSSSSSTFTVSGLPSASQGEEVAVEGLPHSEARLEARRYKSSKFAADLLNLLRDELHVKTWTSPNLEVSGLKITKVAGSLTNAVFFASYQTGPSGGFGPKTVLLRIYGPSSGSLISRPHELRTLHMLSSVYGIGPRVFGTFGNGRVEEYFESSALTPADLRDPQTSRWIARRMRELHRVDVEIVSGEEWNDLDLLAVRRNVRDWLAPAVECLDLLTADSSSVTDMDENHPWWRVREDIDLDLFYRQWHAYVDWLKEWEKGHSVSPRVFAHNDTQYGNLLRLAHPKENVPNHHHIIVVDFEYAGPNPAAFDIANHFLEWTADYNTETPHLLNSERYPSADERRNFYRAYLSPVPPPPSKPAALTPAFGPITAKMSLPFTPLTLQPIDPLTDPTAFSLPPASSPAASLNGTTTAPTTPSSTHPPSMSSHTSSSNSIPPLPSPSSHRVLRSKASIASISSIALDEAPPDSELIGVVDGASIDQLEAEVQAWTPAAMAMWSVWGIVQARDDVLAGGVGEFDYLNYTRGRIQKFREEIAKRGIQV